MHKQTVQQKVALLIDYFSCTMPNPKSELSYLDIYQLTVAVVLSAQCTDKRVNIITPPLFDKYTDFFALASASQNDVFQLIKSCTYPNNKSKNLINLAKTVVKDYNGTLPNDRDQLCTLPGIGRKTANVICSVAFGMPYFAVDTHVFRVANRIGIANAKTPLQTEEQLTALFPDEVIPNAHHWLLLHGRYCCKASSPNCRNCSVSSVCDYFAVNHPVV